MIRWPAISGMVPLEDSSGNRRRLGHITKQGSSILRFLLVEAAQVTVRSLSEWRSRYFHLMMRQRWDYQQWIEFGSHAGQPVHRRGVQ
jgi:transposase